MNTLLPVVFKVCEYRRLSEPTNTSPRDFAWDVDTAGLITHSSLQYRLHVVVVTVFSFAPRQAQREDIWIKPPLEVAGAVCRCKEYLQAQLRAD